MPRYRPPWVPRPPEKVYLFKHHGITQEDWWELWRAQGGCCAICGSKTKRLQVDHTHKADHRVLKRAWSRKGAIRGLVCFHCNTALQRFNDNPWLMRQAAGYIDAPPAWALWVKEKRPLPDQGELFPEEEVNENFIREGSEAF